MIWAEGVFRILELDPTSTSPSYELFASGTHPDDQAKVVEAHNACLDRHCKCDVVYRLLLADGRIKHVRRVCRIDVNPDGKSIEAVGVLQDVTVIRQAEEQRVLLEAQLHHGQKLEAIGVRQRLRDFAGDQAAHLRAVLHGVRSLLAQPPIIVWALRW